MARTLEESAPALPPGTLAGRHGLYTIAERPYPAAAPIVFVGGTGRSGTHVVARLLGRNAKMTSIPVECRFHVDPDGFPGLLAGTVSKEKFIKRLEGFWWKGQMTGRERGLFRFVDPLTFEAAVSQFQDEFDADAELACRNLYLNLLWPRAVRKGKSGVIEQSCRTIAMAPTLVRLFPEARFVHVVRDGRDASASRVAQTRGRTYPRTRRQGLRWWESRLRDADQGARAIPEGRLLEVRLEQLLLERRPNATELARFAGVRLGQKMRRYLFGQMDTQAANAGRWRDGLSERRQRSIESEYESILDRLEADEVTALPLLRQDLEPESRA